MLNTVSFNTHTVIAHLYKGLEMIDLRDTMIVTYIRNEITKPWGIEKWFNISI